MDVVSKSDFARLMNVTPTRVGQWLREGKIGPDALEGEGRNARIRVSTARQQLGARIDIGQRFGNGIDTRIDFEAPAIGAAPAPIPHVDPYAERIKAERLRGLKYANQRAAEEELARRGVYIRADESAAAMTRLAANLVDVFEGAIGDFAQAVAAKFQLPTRDVTHLLRTEFRAVRTRAAASARRHVETLPAHLEAEVPDASDPALGEA